MNSELFGKPTFRIHGKSLKGKMYPFIRNMFIYLSKVFGYFFICKLNVVANEKIENNIIYNFVNVGLFGRMDN